MSATTELSLPPHYDPKNVVNSERWIDYNGLMAAAIDWRKQHSLKASSTDRFKLGVLGIDVQGTFCDPKGELFVSGRSGNGAAEDSRRFVEFLYRNLGRITEINCTLDTHRAFAIFHPTFLVDEDSNHPAPFTEVSHKDVLDGAWKVSPLVASALGVNLMAAQKQLEHYTAELEKRGRYQLTIWPFHGMLGDKGHNLVSGLVEAINFHAFARGAQPGLEVKGTNPWVENYSVLGPEVTQLFNGTPVPRNTSFIEKLLRYDALVITGQAKSHCVAWTIDDLLQDILQRDPALAKKVYLLEDCTSPVVVPGVVDHTDHADAAFSRFENAGMHVVRSTDPISNWPGIQLAA